MSVMYGLKAVPFREANFQQTVEASHKQATYGTPEAVPFVWSISLSKVASGWTMSSRGLKAGEDLLAHASCCLNQ
jgi:hypothetical protein